MFDEKPKIAKLNYMLVYDKTNSNASMNSETIITLALLLGLIILIITTERNNSFAPIPEAITLAPISIPVVYTYPYYTYPYYYNNWYQDGWNGGYGRHGWNRGIRHYNYGGRGGGHLGGGGRGGHR